MGVDIHMFVIKDNEILKDDMFDGRNSEWFNNLSGTSISDPTYHELCRHSGWKNINCPEELYKEYCEPQEGDNICYFYGHTAIKVGDFLDWFYDYCPDKKAGYAPRYIAWLASEKNIMPSNDDVRQYVSKAEIEEEDLVWFEYTDKYEPSIDIAEQINNFQCPRDAWIIFCFDC